MSQYTDELDVEADEASLRARYGGKGMYLRYLRREGVAVPPFTVLTASDLAVEPPDRGEIAAILVRLRDEAVSSMGVSAHSVTFAVRSSSSVSMPGMMDTVLGMGMSPERIGAVGSRIGSVSAAESFLCSSARSLCVRLAGAEESSVVGLDYSELVRLFETRAGMPFPSEPEEQVERAVGLVRASWNNQRARDYRSANAIPDSAFPAVVIQAMAYGTGPEMSVSGVVFSHDPLTGACGLHGEYIPASTGEDLVGGTKTPESIETLRGSMPSSFENLSRIVMTLFENLTVVVEVEFVVERGQLWIVQVRPAVVDDAVRNRVTVDSWRTGTLDRRTALGRIALDELFMTSAPHAAPGGHLLAVGVPASTGVATGVLVTQPHEVLERLDECPILLRPTTEPDDFVGMLHSAAIVTLEGGSGSHAAVVARELGKPAVVGARFIDDDWLRNTSDRCVTVCGTTGRVWEGAAERIDGCEVDFPYDLLDFSESVPIVVTGLDRVPVSVLVTTDRHRASSSIVNGESVAFVCSPAPIDRPWAVDIPDAAVDYIVVESDEQARYVIGRLAINMWNEEGKSSEFDN